MEQDIFYNKKFNITKLKNFGFRSLKNSYVYDCSLMNGDFNLRIETSGEFGIKTTLTENETGEIYTLHLTNAQGEFVGHLREEYRSRLEKIAETCSDPYIFKSAFTYKVIDYIKSRYNDEPEYLWEKAPNNAVMRRKDNSKWYIAILTVKKDRLGFESTEDVEVADLRARAEEIPRLLSRENIYPAYHMNKKHWVTVILDGTMPFDEICQFIDTSYELARKSK